MHEWMDVCSEVSILAVKRNTNTFLFIGSPVSEEKALTPFVDCPVKGIMDGCIRRYKAIVIYFDQIEYELYNYSVRRF
jgi:hypothetical protein